MFQACGWLYPSICFALVAGISIWAGLFLTKAISRVDGNAHLEKRVEYNEITQTYLPRWAYLISMTALLFNFQASNISSIGETTPDMPWISRSVRYAMPSRSPFCASDGLHTSSDCENDVWAGAVSAAVSRVRVHYSVCRPHHRLVRNYATLCSHSVHLFCSLHPGLLVINTLPL